MKFVKLPCLVLSGMVLSVGAVHAENAVNQSGTVKPVAAVESPAVRQKLLQDADKLIKVGKAADAYALLEPEQSRRAGDPDYDYLLGIAALDSGRPTEAIFALERVLAVKPKHLQARAEIARAYLASGEKAAAKQEFEAVQSQNPPKEVNATIQRFLDAINQGQGGKSALLNGYLEASIGNDSNVNSATGSNQVAIPAFGGAVATLNASGVQTRDSYATVSGGGDFRHPLSPEWSVFGGVNLNERKNLSQHIFNTGEMAVNMGLSLTNAEDSFSAALQLQGFKVDGQSYRDASGMTVEWQRNLKESTSKVSSYFQYTNLKYPDQSLRDANRYVLGAAYAGMLSGEHAPAVYGSLYAGQEKQKQSSAPYLGHKLFGLRTGGELSFSAQTKMFASLSIELRRYGGDDPFFLVTRKDTQFDLKAGANYVMDKVWTLTPQFSYTMNKSNIVISDYKRSMISIGLRREFN